MAMESTQPPSKNTSRTNIYFGITIGLLYLLAVVWSIDSSFFYTLTGAIIFFFFLGLRNNKFLTVSRHSADENSFTKNSARVDTKQETIFKPVAGFSTSRTRTNKVLVISIVISIIAGFFITFVIFITVLILYDHDDDDSGYDFQQAEYFYNQGTYDSAKIFYRRSISSNPESTEALTGYGNTLLMEEQYDSAILLFDKALAIDPAYDKATYQKGATLSYQKNYDQSISELKNMLRSSPSYFDAMQLIGDSYYNQQKYDSALNWYNDAYKNGVRNRYLCHLMGYIHETKGDKNNAIKLYEEALGYDSSVLDIYQRLSELLPDDKGNFYRRKATELNEEVKQ